MSRLSPYVFALFSHDESFREEIRQKVGQFKDFRLFCFPDQPNVHSFFQRNRPSVILLEGNANVLRGNLQLIAYLRKDQEHIPYIIVALDEGSDKDEELKAVLVDKGADFLIGKEIMVVNLPAILKMVARHEKALDTLRFHQDQMASILAHQQELICRFLPDTTLTYINEAYARYFGKTTGELVGTRFLDLIPASEHEGVISLLASCSPKNNTKTYRHQVKLPEGGTGWQEWTDHAFFDSKGRLTGFQSVGRDVSEEVFLRESLIKSEINERRRISSELHDHIGHMLVLIKIGLEKHLSAHFNCVNKSDMEESLYLIQETMRELRLVSRRMVAGFVKTSSFREALHELVSSCRQVDHLSIIFNTRYVPNTLSELAQTNIYRILQEALANSLKHGQATRVRINLYQRRGVLRLSYRDNGKGMDLSSGYETDQFRTIRYRTLILGGTIDFNSKPGQYFHFNLQVPMGNLVPDEKVGQ